MRVQIILSGVGGQGILFTSKVVSELGLKLGLNVMGSEEHGMSQRGGSVIAHLKLGNFHSPLVREGTADILYSFEKDETYKTLKFLRKGGACFVNLGKEEQFDKKILLHLKKKGIAFRAFDADRAALELGSILAANSILIGYSVGTGLVPFSYRKVKEVIESASRKKNIAFNRKALELGCREGKREELKVKSEM